MLINKNSFGGARVFLDGQEITNLGPEECDPEMGWVRVRKLRPDSPVLARGSRLNTFKLRGLVELRKPVASKPVPPPQPVLPAQEAGRRRKPDEE